MRPKTFTEGLPASVRGKTPKTDFDISHSGRQSDSSQLSPEIEESLNTFSKSDIADGNNFLFEYFNWLDLRNKSNVIVLPESHHYYFDPEDLKGVQTIIILRPVNHVKRIGTLLGTILQFLPENGSLVGCFTSNGKKDDLKKSEPSDYYLHGKEESIDSGMKSSNQVLNRIFSIMDLRKKRKLDKNSFRKLLRENGYAIDDLTEMNGITYFHAYKE